MHEVPRLIPTIRKKITKGPFKIFVSASLLALDSNRAARTSRVFKIGINGRLPRGGGGGGYFLVIG